ncbi:MAG: hypothetical protein Tsb0033_25320 [Winogradskyella sp.]
MNPKDTNITITVDTNGINDQNKNQKVIFSDDLGDPQQPPGHPEQYTSTVYKDQKITWTAYARNGQTPITIENIKKDGGKVLMKDLKRGDGANKYTAKIKDGNDGDEENYSVTIGLAGYEGMAGSNENGPIVYLGHKVAYMNSYQNNVWNILSDAPFEIEGVTGYNTSGPIIFSGNRVAYMNNYKENIWIEINPAPFEIQGIAGENTNGVIVYSGNRVAHINYKQGRWVEIANAPFDIQGIAGDNTGGPIVYSGNELAYMNDYSINGWNPIFDAPFNIEGIYGSFQKGVVIYAANQVAYSNGPLFTGSSFTEVANAPFIIEGISGNAARGPIVFSGGKVRYMPINIEKTWFTVSDLPFDTKTITIDPRLRMKTGAR